jgi:hypothetical protein
MKRRFNEKALHRQDAKEMVWKFPSLLTWVRIVPSLTEVSAVPVATSVMSTYYQSALGKAMTGSEVSCFCRA